MVIRTCARRRALAGPLARLVLFALGALCVVTVAGRADGAPGACVAPSIGEAVGGVGGGFTPITPTRLLDTRTETGSDGVGAGCVARVALSPVVPAGATGVAATVTLTDAEGEGFATAYPCGSPRPYISNVNTRADSAVPNMVLAPVDSTRQLCVFTSVAAQIIVDVTGWFGSGGGQFHDVTPTRALDTRFPPNPPATPVGAGTAVTLVMTRWVPAYATAVAVNVTVTQTSAAGFATVFPCGGAPPVSSNVNFVADEDRAAQAIVGLGNGSLCIYLSADAHLIVDLWGWFGGAEGARVVPTRAARLVDSRTGEGGWGAPVAAGETRSLDVPQIPGGVRSAMVDVVAVGGEGSGYLTVFACGTPQPATSSVNYVAARAVMNLVTVPLGADGKLCVYSSARVDVIVDLLAVTDNPGPLRSISVSPKSLSTNFVPTGHDYAVICEVGVNALSVTAVSLPGYTIAIGATTALNRLTASVDVSPNQLIEIDVLQGLSVVDRYYVRCLPPDFPPIHAIAYGAATPGWYMVTPATFAPGSHYALITDERGVPLWYRKATTPILDFKRLAVGPHAGQLAWVPVLGQGFGVDPTRGYEIHQLDGTLVKSVLAVGPPTDQHDIIALPNGNFALFAYEQVLHIDLTALGTGFTADEAVVHGRIQEIDPAGALVWEWKAEDHINITESTYPIRFNLTGTSVVDLQHFNALDVAPNGDYIVSARHMDAVFRVSRTTDTITWKLGGTAANKDLAPSLQILNDPLGGPKRLHDARLLPDGSISLFDNRLDSTGATRAAIYAIDAIGHKATLIGSYARSDGIQVGTMGSARVSADGHVVIGWGANAPLATELDSTNAVVLELTGPDGGSYRAIKEPASSFDRATLRSSSPG
ncbi:MAG: arylsulfotransferase family protein [Acidimicrobiales bacterium]